MILKSTERSKQNKNKNKNLKREAQSLIHNNDNIKFDNSLNSKDEDLQRIAKKSKPKSKPKPSSQVPEIPKLEIESFENIDNKYEYSNFINLHFDE